MSICTHITGTIIEKDDIECDYTQGIMGTDMQLTRSHSTVHGIISEEILSLSVQMGHVSCTIVNQKLHIKGSTIRAEEVGRKNTDINE